MAVQIEIDQLEGKEGAFAHTYQPEELALGDENVRLTRMPEISGRINCNGQEVQLRGRITAQAEVDCDRCLKPVAVPIDTKFDVTYIPAADYAAGAAAAELQEADLNVSVYEDETIDVDELVREQVLLALPRRALCREDCQGLCPACGADKNTDACSCETKEMDPRWAALKDLRF